MEELLLTIYRKHQLSISCSIESESIPHLPSPDTRKPVEVDYYVRFALAHPKHRKMRFWQKMYSPVALVKIVFESQNLVWLMTGAHQSKMMDIVSAALVELGGVREE